MEKEKLTLTLIEILKQAKGCESRVGLKKIITTLEKIGCKTTRKDIRDRIHYIRNKNLIPGLITQGTKFYVAQTKDEVTEYIECLNYGEKNLEKRLAALRAHRSVAIEFMEAMQ